MSSWHKQLIIEQFSNNPIKNEWKILVDIIRIIDKWLSCWSNTFHITAIKITPTRIMTVSKWATINAERDLERERVTHTLLRSMEDEGTALENHWSDSKKNFIQPSNCTPRYSAKRGEKAYPYKNLPMCGHSNIIPKNQAASDPKVHQLTNG